MHAIIFTPDRNTPGRHDHTGAFRPEARSFCKAHGIPFSAIHEIDTTLPEHERRASVFRAIDESRFDFRLEPLSMVAFFCHGLRGRLPQMGIRAWHTDELASRLLAHSPAPDLTVVLYCCDVARDDDADTADDRKDGPDGVDGFASRLRDSLVSAGLPSARVFGHATAGHTTRNPFLRVFEAPVGSPGEWVVSPADREWKRWRAALKGDLRLRFPTMALADVRAEVSR